MNMNERPGKNNQAHILVIDDDPNITSFLRRALTYSGYDVSTANSGEDGLALALQKPPDLAIVDVMMPGIDGFEVVRRLRAGGDEPILMLTARDEVGDRVQGLDTGADDYLVKPFALEELQARLRALLRRTEPAQRAVFSFGDLVMNLETREVRRGDRPIDLTSTEFELLTQFMRHPRQVLTRETLLERVWNVNYSVESHVVEVYVGYLRSKLEAGGESRILHTVRGIGYVLRESAG